MSNKTEKNELPECDKIWSEIKDKKIEMFSLPNQQVHQYCKMVNIDPSKLYLEVSATSVLPALELALGSAFKTELVGRFVVVSRVV